MKRAAVVYRLEDGKLSPVEGFRAAPVQGERPPSPAGGLFSTVSDLSKLYQMMLHRGTLGGRRLLSESAVDQMTRLQTGEIQCGFVDGMGFGLGWGYVKQPQGVTEALSPGTFGHGGAYGTQAWIDPRKGRFAILMIQRSGLANSDNSPMRREFQKVAFPITPP
jgi:CubicO group peptidase (beta-lactamase class C family)